MTIEAAELPAAAQDAPGDRPKGIAVVLAAAFLWSLAGLMVRLIEGASTWQIVFYRSLFIAIALALYLTWRYRGGCSGRSAPSAGWACWRAACWAWASPPT